MPGFKKREIKRHLRELLPQVSMSDFQAIEEIANAGHLRHLPPSISAWQAITTHIRHAHTDYDSLLGDGYDTESARHFVLAEMNEILTQWGCQKQITDQD